MAVKVIGLGNRLYGDDAIGSIIAECINAYDASANGFQALTYIEKDDVIFIVDAMMMDEEYNLFKVDLNQDMEVEISDPHRLTPLQVLFLAKKAGREPKEAYILAIKPEKVDWPGLTDQAIERAKNLFLKYKDFLKSKGVEVNVEELEKCLKEKKDRTW